jgi:hypothetical protein
VTDRFTVTVEGVAFDVEFTYTPPCSGDRERGTGLALEPDSPEELELERVEIGGEDITCLLSDKAPDLDDAIYAATLREIHERRYSR